MIRPIALIILVVAFAAPAAASADAVPGELIVRYELGASPEQRAQARDAGELVLAEDMSLPDTELAEIRDGQTPEEAAAEVSAQPGVRYAEPNHVIRAQTLPNDYDAARSASLRAADVPAAWELGFRGDPAVTVAIADSGIALGHPDLLPALWTDTTSGAVGHDFVDDDDDPRDLFGHGSHVAGIVGAAGDNGLGIAGVAWRTRLMPLRILDHTGTGSVSDLIAAIAYARDRGVKILNASVSADGTSQAVDDALAASRDVLVVVAAGNGEPGRDLDAAPSTPCSSTAPNVLCVGASAGEADGGLASFSNRSQTSVDLAAPGANVWSTVPVVTTQTLFEDGFEVDLATWTSSNPSRWKLEKVANRGQTLSDLPAAQYPNNSDTNVRLKSSVSLANLRYCKLDFEVRQDLAPDAADTTVDTFSVEANTATSGTWTPVGSYTAASDTGAAFVPRRVNLEAFDGKPVVYVRFRLKTGAKLTANGIAIDDVKLRCFAPADDNYNAKSGTSMAAAHVSGTAALLAAAHPDWAAPQFASAIVDSVAARPALAATTRSGGQLDTFRAVGGLRPGPPVPRPAVNPDPPAPDAPVSPTGPRGGDVSLPPETEPQTPSAGDTIAPGVTRLRAVTPRGKRNATTVAFTLSEDGQAAVTLEKARKCPKVTTGQKAKRCAPWKVAKKATTAGKRGDNNVSLGKLSKGSYRISLTVRDGAGNSSRAQVATFKRK